MPEHYYHDSFLLYYFVNDRQTFKQQTTQQDAMSIEIAPINGNQRLQQEEEEGDREDEANAITERAWWLHFQQQQKRLRR